MLIPILQSFIIYFSFIAPKQELEIESRSYLNEEFCLGARWTKDINLFQFKDYPEHHTLYLDLIFSTDLGTLKLSPGVGTENDFEITWRLDITKGLELTLGSSIQEIFILEISYNIKF